MKKLSEIGRNIIVSILTFIGICILVIYYLFLLITVNCEAVVKSFLKMVRTSNP